MSDKNPNVVGVSLGITRNLGNFNSLRFDAWASSEVKEGEDREAVFDRLWAEVDAEIEEKLNEANEVAE